MEQSEHYKLLITHLLKVYWQLSETMSGFHEWFKQECWFICAHIKYFSDKINSQYSVRGNLVPASALLDTHSSIQLSDGSFSNRGMSLHRYLDTARTMSHRMYLSSSSIRLIRINFRLDYASYHRGTPFVPNFSKNYASIREK